MQISLSVDIWRFGYQVEKLSNSVTTEEKTLGMSTPVKKSLNLEPKTDEKNQKVKTEDDWTRNLST